MTSTSTTASEPVTNAYGLTFPSVRDAREAISRLYETDAASVWAILIASARVQGTETDRRSLEDLVAAMCRHPDPVITLCGKAFAIRVSSYDHLSAAHAALQGESS